MKKIIMFTSIFCLLFAGPALADHCSDKKSAKDNCPDFAAVYHPDSNSVVILGCYNKDPANSLACQALRQKMQTDWKVIPNPDTDCFFSKKENSIRKIILVEVGGRSSRFGVMGLEPGSVYIRSDNYHAIVQGDNHALIFSEISNLH